MECNLFFIIEFLSKMFNKEVIIFRVAYCCSLHSEDYIIFYIKVSYQKRTIR